MTSQTLLKCLNHNIWDKALAQMRSYLSKCYHMVCVNGEPSSPVLLEYSVPLGSVLGPKNYVMYTKPLENIIKHYGLEYHFYVDDTWIYISFKSNDNVTQHAAQNCIKHWLVDIETWMHHNMLKSNSDKNRNHAFYIQAQCWTHGIYLTECR